ncbi:hypothetical protein [Streptomyces sp. NPDC007100]|uniref:hypothetical protein n=1 Tax=Streptomyces sp. NPDC007100 TaxID=3155602 RepID=UPI00340D3375
METPVHQHGATVQRHGADAEPHHRSPAATALPVAAAALFGLWTVFVDRTSGSSLGHAWLLGLIAALVSGALGLALVRVQSSMITEVRALAYGALFGTAMGYLYSIAHASGPSILESVRMGLVLGAVMFAVSLYVFRTHRTREPHGQHRPRGSHRAHRPRTTH